MGNARRTMQRPVATDELEEHAGRNGGKRVAVKTHTLAERSLPGIGRGATLSGLDRAGRSQSGFSGGHSGDGLWKDLASRPIT